MPRDSGPPRHVAIAALAVLAVIWLFRLCFNREDAVSNTGGFADDLTRPSGWAGTELDNHDNDDDAKVTDPIDGNNTAPGPVPVPIVDKVAIIIDTQYTTRLIPLIMHYHAVLGPAWPIVFFTTQEVLDQIQQSTADLPSSSSDPSSDPSPDPPGGSAIWRRTIASGAVDVRYIPPEYNLTIRYDNNAILCRPWLWNQLAPAKHVLVFQTDSIMCANSARDVGSFLKWDFIGSPYKFHEFNGGLSLRNRPMMLDVLAEGRSWEADVAAGTWREALGEDLWFSRMFEERNASLPDREVALRFSLQFDFNLDESAGRPLGFHKVHRFIKKPGNMERIVGWCPEIHLARAGSLESYKEPAKPKVDDKDEKKEDKGQQTSSGS